MNLYVQQNFCNTIAESPCVQYIRLNTIYYVLTSYIFLYIFSKHT